MEQEQAGLAPTAPAAGASRLWRTMGRLGPWRALGVLAVTAGVLAGGVLMAAQLSRAQGDYGAMKPIPVLVTLGNEADKLTFSPDRLRFETGKLYKLLLFNASPQKHEFDAPALSKAVYSVKTEVVSPDGVELAEIEGGSVGEIEMAPGTTVEWYFIPLRTVEDAPFICDLPGHMAGGMHGRFRID